MQSTKVQGTMALDEHSKEHAQLITSYSQLTTQSMNERKTPLVLTMKSSRHSRTLLHFNTAAFFHTLTLTNAGNPVQFYTLDSGMTKQFTLAPAASGQERINTHLSMQPIFQSNSQYDVTGIKEEK